MLIGIDVGGTYTDGVLFSAGKIAATSKRPTSEEDIRACVLEVLDDLLDKAGPGEIERIVLSTTLVTNILATGQGEDTALILLPGYGLPHDAYQISPATYYLKGAIDFRGREIEPLEPGELKAVCREIADSGVKRAAVAAKFANRNDSLEKQVRDYINRQYPDIIVSISSEVSAKLNFPRRAASTYYTAMTIKEWNRFVDDIEKALADRKLFCEAHVLKADGGTVPLNVARRMPCETVFSGPAASTMGALALSRDEYNSVVLDIGGTTTDIALIIGGEPLYASKGARIEEHYTQINAFAVRSIPLGGDSALTAGEQGVKLESFRRGPAVCFGGQTPTVTDVFNVYNQLAIGDEEHSRKALQELAAASGQDMEALCRDVINQVKERVLKSIREMFEEWENEPAYKVWEVIHRRRFELQRMIGIGAAARAIVPLLADEMNVPCFLHQYADVANALGASVVRPTLSVQLHIDTQTDSCAIDPGGIKTGLKLNRNFQLQDAKEMARQQLEEIGRARGMQDYTSQYKFFMEEQFNMIRGYNSSGKLFEVGIQVTPGFIEEFKGVEI
ncbi:hydantoinase/oxoprolinase family protein [Syntrophomonas palmitatica]|uniref:hydantoinase/oxoprolinase family protein n=1 Tax=Syntrophomonas palmitatica TaxID=402877 RepID=UPI0006D1D6D1|nr:hydantoinase/oxoprolinase family protein [Syntrophomonas palmitatica]